MDGRRLESLAALALAALGGCSGGGEPRPNVVLITLDTVRADHLSSYGYALPTTPCLDRLAADGVRFETCAATAALTPVSHASILTGLNPYSHGLRVLHAASGYRLPESVPTLATELGEAGYATAAILSAFPVSEAFGLERGFGHFDNGMLARAEARDARRVGEREGARAKRGGGRGGANADKPRAATQRRSDATTDAAIEWLAGAREPWCLWLHYWDVHDPLLVPPAGAIEPFRAAARAATGADPSLYDAELHFLDREIGRLLDELRRRGLYDTALIVVTSDHGEGLGEHGWHAHRLLYEEQTHVPLIVKWPGGDPAPPRGVVRELVRTIDILPTVLEAAGVAAPARVEGRSVLSLARGEREPPRLAYADQLNKWDTLANMLHERPRDDLLHALRDARWKLIYRPLRPGESELYDLERDPDEAVNLFASEPERARALVADLEARDPFVLEDLGQGASDDEAAEALRDLGYLGDE